MSEQVCKVRLTDLLDLFKACKMALVFYFTGIFSLGLGFLTGTFWVCFIGPYYPTQQCSLFSKWVQEATAWDVHIGK